MIKKSKILVVDDDPDIVEILRYNLSLEGYDVKTVNNGLDAIDSVRDNHFDLVFLDENMPGISGLEALKVIKELNANIPF